MRVAHRGHTARIVHQPRNHADSLYVLQSETLAEVIVRWGPTEADLCELFYAIVDEHLSR